MSCLSAAVRSRPSHSCTAINGGFGLLLDGSERVDNIIRSGLEFDSMVGVARRSWARNEHAVEAVAEWNKANEGKQHITAPHSVAESQATIDALFK